MGERWIVDASPIIALAKIGQAPLLEQITDELLVPEAVASEVLSAPPEEPARILLESESGRRAAPGELPARVLDWSLGRGETEVLALGLEQRGSRVVIDDAAARRCAIALEVPMIGTFGGSGEARASISPRRRHRARRSPSCGNCWPSAW